MDNHKLGSSMRTNVVKLHNMSIKKNSNTVWLAHNQQMTVNHGQKKPRLKKKFFKGLSHEDRRHENMTQKQMVYLNTVSY